MGKKILQQARSILLQVEDLQHFSETKKVPLSYPLTIGIIPTIAPYILPKLLAALNQKHPYLQLNVVEDKSLILLNRVRQGELDAKILALLFPCDGMLTLKFCEEDFYWVTLKRNKYSQQQGISNDELKNCIYY